MQDPESAPAETRPLLRVGYITMRAIAGTLYGIAAHLDLPPAVWSGPRARLGQGPGRPRRPAHREPAAPDNPAGSGQDTETSLRMPG